MISLLIFSSCMTSSPRHRGSLSDAMDKSRDDYEDERDVPDEPDPWEIEEREPENQRPASETQQSQQTGSNGPSTILLLTRGGYEFSGGPFFDRGYDGEILVGTPVGQRAEVYLYGDFNNLHTEPSHTVSESIKGDVLTLGVGGEGSFLPPSRN